jgi:predicted DNA-binding protein (MmcQ/YjbR family)
MKKFFGSFFVFIIVLLLSIVAVPWNDLSQWSVPLTILTDYEVYIKGGVVGLAFIFSLIFLFVANKEYNEYNHVTVNTARAAFLPLYIATISMLVFGSAINFRIYQIDSNSTNLIVLGIFVLAILNLIIYGHIFANNFRRESNGKRVLHYILLVQFVAIAAYGAYWFYTWKLSQANYQVFNSFYFVGAAGFGILMYILHIIFSASKGKKNSVEDELEQEIEDMVDNTPKARESQVDEKPRKKKHREDSEVVIPRRDGKKTMIVSNQQTIVSGEKNIDPTNLIYEDVDVDPEFTKTTSQVSSPNSIEYYIEKPKMFKPLDPTFDQLVAYVRELPQVVTKLDDMKITFYVDRKPFLVLMNFGNYYRLAFKYELEKGIRLIIKYPTISKNKSTRDELWFKANNYGDIPKDVIYQIVKSSYDSVNL